MPIDSSIYFQQQTPDIAGALQRGMNFRQMLDQRSKQSAIEDAYRQGAVVNPDGTTTIDANKTMSALAKADPQQAMEFQRNQIALAQQKEKLNQEKRAHTVDMISRVAPSMTDQSSYEKGIAQLKSQGVDMSNVPQTFDPQYMSNIHAMALSAKDQMELANKDRDFGAKQKELDLKHEENSIKRDQVSSEKVDKLAKDFKNDMDADRGRSGNFGQISAKVQQADRLKTLVQSYKNGDLPPAQMEELALGMANMLAGSNGSSRAQVEALVPHTWWGGKQNAQQWLMNEPMGAGQQKFVEQMAHTIDRERDTANEQLNQIRASRLSSHDRFKKMAPDQYQVGLRSYGIDQNNIKDGKYQPPPTGLVLMKDPQGNVRQVSADQVEAAKKAGGTVVNQAVADGK